MDFVYDTLALYKLAFLKRFPFQLSLHLAGAIHSIITFGNKASSLVLDFFSTLMYSYILYHFNVFFSKHMYMIITIH